MTDRTTTDAGQPLLHKIKAPGRLAKIEFNVAHSQTEGATAGGRTNR